MGGSTSLRPILLSGGELSCETRHTSNSTAFEVTSKRRKGFPSETSVKRGDRRVHGGMKNSGGMIYARAARDAAFKRCCLKAGRYDGALRSYYF